VSSRPSTFSPLRVPAFRRLAGGYALSRIGDMVAMVALAILVWDETHSTFATTGLFIALEFLPALVAPALTARVDRIPTARVLPAIYLAEAAVFVALSFLSRDFSLALLLVLVAFDGALNVVSRALSRSAIAAVLEPSGNLREGNALLNMALAPNLAIGGAAGAGLLVFLGTGGALLVNSATFAVAALVVVTAPDLPRFDAEIEEGGHWRDRFRAGIRYLRSNRTVLILIVGQVSVTVFFALTEPLEVAYMRETLDAGPSAYGAFVAAWGLGIVVGSVIFTWVGVRNLALTALVGTVVQGVSYAALAAAGGIQVACAIALVGGAANGAQIAALGTAIQEGIALEFQARVMSIYEAAMTAGPGIGYVLGGLVGATAGQRAAFMVAGIGVLVVTLAVVLARPYSRGYGRQPQPEPHSA
jgi:predicted MFS family arabinose efflux permease